MNLRQTQNDVLQYLFDVYVEHGGTAYAPIQEAINDPNIDSNEFGSILVANGLVKNQQFAHDGFHASISTYGITVINPNYFEEHFSTIISILGINGGDWMGVMEILEFKPQDFQRAFDIAKSLEDTGFVETQPQHDEIFIKLTLQGRQYYEDRKADFN